MLTYRTNHPVSRAQFIALLQKTSLGARRPLAEAERIDAMRRYRLRLLLLPLRPRR